MTQKFDKAAHLKAQQAKFDALTERRTAIIARSKPLRENRDKFSAEVDAKLRAMADEIKKVEADLFALDQERSMIQRVLQKHK